MALTAEKIDWGRAPADTPVCPEKEIYLRDIVQTILDGYETPEEVMEALAITPVDVGADQIQEILAIFVPVINAWRSGAGCGGNCGSCGGGCAG